MNILKDYHTLWKEGKQVKECVFCNIVKTGNNNNEKERNVILYEDDLLLITQATGSPVRGYLMIVIKRHINGFAE